MAVGSEHDLLPLIRTAADNRVPVQALEWVVSNPAVLSIDALTGRAKALSAGTVVVTVRTPGVEAGSAQIVVTVTDKQISGPEITVVPMMSHLAVGESVSLQAQVRLPDGQVNGNVVWSSSDSTIASVNPSSGVATVLKPGRVTILASYLVDSRFSGLATLMVYRTRTEIPPSPVPSALSAPSRAPASELARPTPKASTPSEGSSVSSDPPTTPIGPSATKKPTPSTAAPSTEPTSAPQGLMGVVSTLAGSSKGFQDGRGTDAMFDYPRGLAVGPDGTVYVADSDNHRIRKISPSGVVTTFAGSTQGFSDGVGEGAQFNGPRGLAIDSAGNLYVADRDNNCIREVSPDGTVSTIAGQRPGEGTETWGYTDGKAGDARFSSPYSLAWSPDGSLYIADVGNNRIRKLSPDGVVTTLAGSAAGFADGLRPAGQFNYLAGLTLGPDGTLYVVDDTRIRKVSPKGAVTTLAGSTTQGFLDGTGTGARFTEPYGVAYGPGGILYVSDYDHHIRKVTLKGVVTTLAGSTQGFADGRGSLAQFNSPNGVAFGPDGILYVTDTYNHRIRMVR
jgi:sugar lactone lactonase YvrE